jgi:hypothetical protein
MAKLDNKHFRVHDDKPAAIVGVRLLNGIENLRIALESSVSESVRMEQGEGVKHMEYRVKRFTPVYKMFWNASKRACIANRLEGAGGGCGLPSRQLALHIPSLPVLLL